jgi:general secretion pathway protein L
MALILGIDISKTSVRGALIRTSLRNVEVERYLACPVAAFGAEATGGHSQEAVAVRELMRMLGLRPDSVVAAVDGLRVSARTLRIPLATKKRAAEVLPFELESQLPFEVTSAIIDFQDVADEDSEAELLVVAAPDHAIEQTLALFTEAGVDPKELAAGHAALDGLMVVEPSAPGDVLLLLNVDTASTDVCLVRDGRTELCRTLDEGLDDAAQNPGALLRALHQTLMKYRSEGGAIPTACRIMGVGAEVPAQV